MTTIPEQENFTEKTEDDVLKFSEFEKKEKESSKKSRKQTKIIVGWNIY